jgi:hypothetical protein
MKHVSTAALPGLARMAFTPTPQGGRLELSTRGETPRLQIAAHIKTRLLLEVRHGGKDPSILEFALPTDAKNPRIESKTVTQNHGIYELVAD